MITTPYTQALAWALVHFLWQGAAIGLVAFVVWRYARLSASAKYGIGVALLAAMLAAPVATFISLARSADAVAMTPAASPVAPAVRASAAVAKNANTASVRDEDAPTPGSALRPVVVAVVLATWLAGVGVFSLRLLGGWIAVRRLARRTVRPAGPDVQALARRVAGRLALDRMVGIFESAAVAVPVMVGWVKPAVLLPAAALTGLSTVQLESLLAHELAHVRRHDYLVNLLQGVVETLLFYHPAVWWLSRQVRREREHCCDDLAVGVCDRLVYATALADLASLTSPRRFALAATDGSLLDRVRRILGQTGAQRSSTSPWLPVSFVGLMAAAVLPIAFVSAQTRDVQSQAPRQPVQTPAIAATTQPDQSPLRPVVAEDALAQGVSGGIAGGIRDGISGGVEGGVAAGIAGGIEGGVNGRVIALAAAQNRADIAAKIAALRRDLEATRDRVAVAAQQGADQSQVEDLRKRIAALEAQLAKMLVEQRDMSESARRLSTDQEALFKARQQSVEKETERLEQLYKKGLVTRDTVDRAMLDKQREVLEQAIKERADTDKETRLVLERQLGELQQRDLARQVERSKVLAEKGLMSERDAARAQEALKAKLAEAELFNGLGAAKFALADVPLSEDAQKLVSRGVAGTTSDNDVIDVFKNVSTLKDDGERASVLVRIARERPFTAAMVNAYLSAANTIGADYDRERVFRQPIKLKAGR